MYFDLRDLEAAAEHGSGVQYPPDPIPLWPKPSERPEGDGQRRATDGHGSVEAFYATVSALDAAMATISPTHDLRPDVRAPGSFVKG